jgi:hypothetical protein
MAANQDTRYNITLTPGANNQGTFTLEDVNQVAQQGTYLYAPPAGGVGQIIAPLPNDFVIPNNATFTLTFNAGQQVPNMVGDNITLNLNVAPAAAGVDHITLQMNIAVDPNNNNVLILTANTESHHENGPFNPAAAANPAAAVANPANPAAAASAGLIREPVVNHPLAGGKSRRLYKNKTKKSRKQRRKSKSQKNRRYSRK